MQLAFNNRTRFLNFSAFYYCSFPKEHHSSTVTELVQFLPDVGFFKIHNFFVTFLKNMTRSTPKNCVLSNPLISSSSNTKYGIQKWFMHVEQVYFVLSKQEEHISSISSRHFVPKDQNKLCTHDKNRKRAELWVKIMYLMYL